MATSISTESHLNNGNNNNNNNNNNTSNITTTTTTTSNNNNNNNNTEHVTDHNIVDNDDDNMNNESKIKNNFKNKKSNNNNIHYHDHNHDLDNDDNDGEDDNYDNDNDEEAQVDDNKTSAMEIGTVYAQDIYICPILKTPMYEPVVLNQTGQIYDKASINGWFDRGNNTCPLTGTLLIDKSISPLPILRRCIKDWAKSHDFEIDPPLIPSNGSNNDVGNSQDGLTNVLNNLAQSLAMVSSKGISVYDLKGLMKLIMKQCLPDSYAALVVLRDLISHSDGQHLKNIKKELDIDFLKGLLCDDHLQLPTARLLVTLKGSLPVDELIPLLSIPDIDLQVDILSQLVEYLCNERSSYWVITSAIRRMVSAVSQKLRKLRRRG